jgi:hypothetical protein
MFRGGDPGGVVPGDLARVRVQGSGLLAAAPTLAEREFARSAEGARGSVVAEWLGRWTY